jgi:hypothetical protein
MSKAKIGTRRQLRIHREEILVEATRFNGNVMAHKSILELCQFAENECGLLVPPSEMRRLIKGHGGK